MSKKSESPYGPSFFIRMGVLLFLLVVVGGSFAYDRLVLVPAGEEAVQRVVDACMDANADRAAVHKAAGCEPTATEKNGTHEIEDFNFARILPNLEGYKVSVLYEDGKVTETIKGGITDADRSAFLNPADSGRPEAGGAAPAM